jgi:hypothetical protein
VLLRGFLVEKSGLQIGVPNRGPKSGSQFIVPNWGHNIVVLYSIVFNNYGYMTNPITCILQKIKNHESRIKNQESRIKNQESRIKNQELQIKNCKISKNANLDFFLLFYLFLLVSWFDF